MSRVGRLPIEVPGGVDVEIKGSTVRVKGPKGELRQHIPTGIDVKVEDGQVVCSRPSDNPRDRANHGLVRALIAIDIVTKAIATTTQP